ncbi:MAG TPA: alcohol dehydrogenase catalytic domain-containing protein [Candidatus Binatia bacterium]|nr:alcohol dehydrogenase catalytic domain-containing protein [Candidatus Binatia bacterium]
MKAVVFDLSMPRIAAAKILGAASPRAFVSRSGPVRCRSVPDPELRGAEWALVAPRLAGICGSDVMQVFIKAGFDNPLSALVSAPHIMGHEVVGTVIETGAAVDRVKKGDRVALSPMLSCAPRGLPPCDACRRGDYPLCQRFFDGALAKGMLAGACSDVGGGFAEAMAVHESMLFPLPESVGFDAAVLADPFAVSLHAVLRAPPEPSQTALVYGCGSLGLMTILALRALFPATRVIAVSLDARQKSLVERLGAERLFTSRGRELVGEIGEFLKAPLRKPLLGPPWLQSGVERVYDTVGSSETLETGVRVASPRAAIVIVGVAPPRRFEWTLIYFKELSLLGSNAYGLETVEGKRANCIEIYLDLLAHNRLDVSGLITHRYPLERYADAFLAARDKLRSRALKVLFEPGLERPQISETRAG